MQHPAKDGALSLEEFAAWPLDPLSAQEKLLQFSKIRQRTVLRIICGAEAGEAGSARVEERCVCWCSVNRLAANL